MPEIAWTPALIALAIVASASTLGAWGWLAYRAYRREPWLPDEGLPLVPWTGRTITLILSSWLLFQMLAVTAVMGLRGAPEADEVRDLPASQMIGAMLLANLLSIATAPAIVRLASGARTWGHLGVGPGSRPALNLGRGYLACFAVIPFVYATYYITLKVFPKSTHVMERVLSPDNPVLSAAVALLGGVLVAPIAEELLFRGVLMAWFARILSGYGRQTDPEEPARLATDWQPNLASALIWAVIHNWPTPIPLLLLGLALGWVYQRTGSLYAPIGLHMAFNGLSAAYLLASGSSPAGGDG
ncbi:MAG: CPBP family intramembrane glutamic endopeptidase [Isosphaeraceae bacterium]